MHLPVEINPWLHGRRLEQVVKPLILGTRASSDPFQYLAEKTAKETDLRKEELELQRQQLQLQAEKQKEQLKVQQEQMKKMMQSQMNTQNLVLALVQKLTKW